MTEAEQPVVARHAPRFSSDYSDLEIPGVVVELAADEADDLGAFEETALSEADAWDANADVGAPQHG